MADDRNLVLIVDDDSMVCTAIARLLKAAGREVAAFESPMTALEMDELDRVACAVLDIMMPGMSGIELARTLLETNPRMAIVFITAFIDEPITGFDLSSGVVRVVAKPFEADELLAAVDGVLRCAMAR